MHKPQNHINHIYKYHLIEYVLRLGFSDWGNQLRYAYIEGFSTY